MSHARIPDMDVTARMIQAKARRLCLRPGFTVQEQEDVAQDLWLIVLSGADEFKPAKGTWEPWLETVTSNHCESLFRRRRAAMRDPAKEAFSLDEEVADPEGNPVPKRDVTPELSTTDERQRDLERDCSTVLAGMNDEQRAVALHLAYSSRYAAGKASGVPRRAMPTVIAEVREILRDAQLDRYLA